MSFALPYNPADYEFVGIEAGAVKDMHNMTNDRLHTSGEKALYPTFVNLGNRETLEGDCDLFVIKLKANRNVKFDLQAKDGFLVNKRMEVRKF
ncbi:f5/8 type C domain protein [Bacteroides sp. CAG:598]|nr:f5/8 type C domain protein [Bacteroides sp. CAG:598]